MRYSGFVGPSYQSQSVTADQEDVYNWYAERLESRGATSQSIYLPTPGVTTISSVTTGNGRGHWGSAGDEYAVYGPTFYKINRDGLMTSKGTVAMGETVTMCSNGEIGGEMFITSGGNGYIFDTVTEAFTQITNLNGKAIKGGFVDGYFLALDTGTSTMYISELLDGLTWDPTQFAQRSIAADPWKSIAVTNRYIYLIGEKTAEVWFDAGTSPFPFAPHPSGQMLPYGITATFAVAECDGSLIWLGATAQGDGYVVRFAGFTPEVISTFAFQSQVGGYTKRNDAVAESYQDQGHTFFLLNFPEAGVTWCYDLQTSLWHKRGTWLSEFSMWTSWRPRFHAYAFQEHRILDAAGGSLYKLSVNAGLDVDSRPLRRLRRAPALSYENERLLYQRLEILLEQGVGLVTGQGSDPMVMMRMSNDGGRNFGTELWRSAGRIGEYQTRAIWNRCGAARQRVFEVVVSDPVPWRLVDAYLKLTDPPQGLARMMGAAA